MEDAIHIKGHITEKQSKQPVEGALVYTELSTTGGIPLYLEARSNASGFYILQGIPKSLSQLTVHVGKEGGSPSYTGTVQVISLPAASQLAAAEFNFSISRIDDWDLTEVWGFPMVTESFQLVQTPAGQPQRATIRGYLHTPPGVPGFAARQDNLKIPFGNIPCRL